MNPRSYFVTGTGTGIGKTVVAAILAKGLGAHYWKPVQTGAQEGTDTEFVSRWIGADRIFAEAYVFDIPLSPHAAALKAGKEILLERVLATRPAIRTPLIVEGAGGVLVPLNSKHLISDLIKGLELPAIVVSRTELGTINHTLLTLDALRVRQIPVAGVVMVGEPNESNLEAIENYGNVKVLAQISWVQEFSETWFMESFKKIEVNLCSTTTH